MQEHSWIPKSYLPASKLELDHHTHTNYFKWIWSKVYLIKSLATDLHNAFPAYIIYKLH